MNIILKTTIISTAVLFASNIHAVPNSFSAGQPARAAEVNENFSDVESQIAAIRTPTTFDYRDFNVASNITNKSFVVSNYCGTHEERIYSRTVNNNGTNVSIMRKGHTAGVVCRWREHHYIETPTERQLTGTSNYTNDGVLQGNTVFENPVIIETSTMVKDMVRVSGSKIDFTPVIAGPTPYTGGIINSSIALEIEQADIVVTAGSYSGCLKITTTRRSNDAGKFQRISWKCPGVGEVKRIHSTIDGLGIRVFELESITTSP